MKRYRFNLEPVLQQRKLIYEQKAREFALEMHQLNIEKQRLADIRRRQSETISAFREKKQHGLKVTDSALYWPYLDRLADEEQAQLAVVEEAENRVKAAREALNQARIQYEIMEKMKERSREVYNDQARREEQKFLDEMGTIRH